MLFYLNIIFIYNKQANKLKSIMKAIINLYHEYKFEKIWKKN